MPLWDITWNKKGKMIKPERMENTPVFKKMMKTWSPQTKKMVRRVLNDAVEYAIETGCNVVWTKTGVLFGHKSKMPKHDVDRLWERITSCVGDGKECLMAVGTLLRWEITKRPEKWLLYLDKKETIDPDTGRNITISNYFVKEDFEPYIPKKHSAKDLMEKFNCH